MLTVSLREFQHKASSYIDQLPIQLTVHDKVVATIVNGAGDLTSNVQIAGVYAEDKISELVQLATDILLAIGETPSKTANLLEGNYKLPPSKALEYGWPKASDDNNLYELSLEEKKLAVGGEAPSTTSATLSRCSICSSLKEDIKPVEYIFDGERTVDEMCASCEGKIPSDMRIKQYGIPLDTAGPIFPKATKASAGDYFKPAPKPEKRKKK